MAAKKKMSSKPKSEQPVDDKPETATLAVQPPVVAPVVIETHAAILAKPRKKKNKFSNVKAELELKPLSETVNEPVVDIAVQTSVDVPIVPETHAPNLAKPRKKKKRNSNNVEAKNDLRPLSGIVGDTETAHLAVQPPGHVTIVTEGHAPILSKPRKKKKNQFSNPEPEDDVKRLLDVIDHSGCAHSTEGSGEVPFVEAEARSPEGPSPTQSENDKLWGFQDTNSADAEKSPLEVNNTPVNLSFLNRAGKDGAGGKGEGGGKQFGFINIARQEALEAVSDFKTRILERAAKKALNDTPFTPSPYPNDIFLYDKPGNSPKDTAMLSLKVRYDAAIIELDPGLAPIKAEIPLNIAKRVAMYISGLLQSHDGQFRCALDGLRAPAKKGQQPLAPWVADTWEERLLDSDRDWLLSKKIDDMTDEKARKYADDCKEFIHKYKLWGHMLEAECVEMGVQIFPRLT